MAKPILLTLSLCFLVLFQCSVAARTQGSRRQQRRQQQQQEGECQLRRLNAQEPQHRVQAEAGVTEFWDWTDDQFQCAGVAVARNIIQPRGLFLPAYTNAPVLIYIVQGRGIHGVMIPGCPETFQSSSQQQYREEGRGRRRSQDQHQKIRQFRQGDIIALPAGVAHWCYNDGEEELVAVVLEHTASNHNQLDENPRKFFLAGNLQPQQQRELYGRSRRFQQQNAGNVFSGFDTEILAETFGVDTETARRLQGQDDQRGHIVRVERDLRVIRPPRSQDEEEEERERGGRYGGRDNGLEQTICSVRLVQNINDPSRADIFNPRAGRITSLNNYNLPILGFLGLSAERGVLYKNAMKAPSWKLNTHTVLYATRGDARMQVVDHRGQNVFDGQIREGQLLVIPQNFAMVKQAGDQGFEYVAFKTNENAIFSALAGRNSVIRAMPLDVLANAYGISREDSRRLKENRQEVVLLAPSERSERRISAA